MRNVLIGLGAILILIIAAILLLPFLIDLNKYQNYYQPMIEEALNRKIVLKNLRLSIIPRIGVRIAGFTVMDDPAFSTGPFASLESLDIGIQFKPLLSGRIEIDDVTLKEPVISVIKNHQGILNVSTLGKGGPSVAAPPPPGRCLSLRKKVRCARSRSWRWTGSRCSMAGSCIRIRLRQNRPSIPCKI